MTTLKKVLILAIGIFAFQNTQAQGVMKDPVSFTLKNGINVVVAENSGMGKVFAGIKIEGEAVKGASLKGITAVLGKMLNENANHNNTAAFENSGKLKLPKVSLGAEEGNLAADAEDFAGAFMAMSASLQEPVLDEQALDHAKENNEPVSLDQVKAFYDQQVRPSRVYITIAGDITVSEARVLTKKAFGDWKCSSPVALAR